MFIDRLAITSSLLFEAAEGSLKWMITALFIYFFTFSEYLPYKVLISVIYFNLYNNAAYEVLSPNSAGDTEGKCQVIAGQERTQVAG